MAFRCVGVEIEWKGSGVDEKGYDRATGALRVEIDPTYFRPAEVDLLWGNPARAEQELGWKAATELPKLVEIMVDYDLKYDSYGGDAFEL